MHYEQYFLNHFKQRYFNCCQQLSHSYEKQGKLLNQSSNPGFTNVLARRSANYEFQLIAAHNFLFQYFATDISQKNTLLLTLTIVEIPQDQQISIFLPYASFVGKCKILQRQFLSIKQRITSKQKNKNKSFLRYRSVSFNIGLCKPYQNMFITSQPFYQKRNFKFSNQLAGKTYSNRRFLSSCSYLDSEFKISTAGSEDEINKIRPQTINADRMPSRSVYSRSKQTRSAAQKFKDRDCRSSIQPSGRKNSAATDRNDIMTKRVYINSQKIETRRFSILDTALTMAQQIMNAKMATRKKSLKRKLAFNPNVDSFYSPYIHIRIIEKIKSFEQMEQKSLKMNFEKIYKKLIRTQLMGQFTANFMEIVERYIRQLVQNGEMYENSCNLELDSSLKTLSRKQQFLQKLIQLWGMNEILMIREIIKYYCIPSEQESDKILKNLLSDLVIQIYQKKCCNRDIQYTFYTVDGEQITHISQIYFSTQQLLLIPKDDAQKNYQFYKKLIEEHDRSLKMTMRQSIKHNFVQKIINNQIDNKKVNYHQDPHIFNESRRQMVEKARIIVQSKSKRRLQVKKDIISKDCRFDEMLQHRSSRKDDLFTNYIIRKQKQKKQYSEILQKLKIILDPNHRYIVKSKLDQKTEQQFRKLHLYNDKYDITYNHNKQNVRKMFLINLIENSDIFTYKTTEQVEKIINMIQSVYGMEMDNIKEIQFWQFKEIYETAHGVSHKDVITKFILNYLVFDQYGEMQKQKFFQIMDICFSHQPRPQRLIKENIWSLFQLMNLIQNKALRKQNLSKWYEPVRVVYLLLLSIIFGKQYSSLDEMARDLLNYYND